MADAIDLTSMAKTLESPNLNILIVGAGIGGLTTALGLRRNDHNITVVERSRFAAERGAAVTLAPNATGILKRFGIDPANDGAVSYDWHTEYRSTGELVSSIDLTTTRHLWQHPSLLCHRVSVHKLLKEAATSAEGVGPPIKILLASVVSNVDVKSTTLHLEDGSVINGDLIIGADGVKSVTRAQVVDSKPFPSSKSAFRFLLERSKALACPLLKDLQLREGEFSMWYGKDRRIWAYTTQHNELLNFVCMYPDPLRQATDSKDAYGENDVNIAHKANMMKVFENFDPRVLAVMDLAEPSTVKSWQLMDMEPGHTRVARNLCLLGDAALPFLPHLGQGAAAAIEDAASLAALFPPGTASKDIPERLQLYDEIRKERPEWIHSVTRELGRDLALEKKDEAFYRDEIAKKYIPAIFAHDEYDNSTQKLREFMFKRDQGHRSMPVAFGPMSGPHQHCWASQKFARFSTRCTIKFKTSRTLVKNFLPTGCIGFEGPGSIAHVSLSYVTFKEAEWLGFDDYSQLGIYIHDLHCTTIEGKPLRGSFLAALFTDSADALVCDRDFGIPAMHCDLNLQGDYTSCMFQAGWKGTQFLKAAVDVTHAKPASSSDLPDDQLLQGLVFTHRYLPSLDRKGEADLSQIICLPLNQQPLDLEAGTKSTVTNAGLTFKVHDRKELPTLHHIVARLAELPIYEVVAASVTSQIGCQGFVDYSKAFLVQQN